MFVRRPLLALALALGCSSESELELLAVTPLEDAGASVEASAEAAVDATDATALDGGVRDWPHDDNDDDHRDGEDVWDGGNGSRHDGGRKPPMSSLVLRYDFAGSGREVLDRVGGRHAQVIGSEELDGSGKLVLNGNDGYVAMPSALISKLNAVTIMVWFEYRAQDPQMCWHRLFDFGSNDGQRERKAQTSLFFTPRACVDDQRVQDLSLVGIELLSTGRGRTSIPSETVVPFMARSMALSFETLDQKNVGFRLYHNGSLRVQGTISFRLFEIEDVNNWLARSQYAQDYNAPITYDEFRIYNRALSPREISRLTAAGPDAP